MQKFKNAIKRLFRDESGQGATEYILLLVVVVAIAVIFKDNIVDIVRTKVTAVGGQISGFTAP